MQESRPKSSPKVFDTKAEPYRLVPARVRRVAFPSLKTLSIVNNLQSQVSCKGELESPQKTKTTLTRLEDKECSMLDESLDQEETRQPCSPTKPNKPAHDLVLETRNKPTRIQLFSSRGIIRNETLGRIDAPTQCETSHVGSSYSAQEVEGSFEPVRRQLAGKPELPGDIVSPGHLQPRENSVCLSLRNIKLPTSQKTASGVTRGSQFTSSMEFKRASMAKLAQPGGDSQIPWGINEFGLLESRVSLQSTLGSKATISGLLSLNSIRNLSTPAQGNIGGN